MDAAINEAIAEKKCPGGVLWLQHDGKVYSKAYGNRSLVPDVEPMTVDTIFDAASLTKVTACTPAVMLLVERGQIDLNAPVSKYIPEFTGDGKEKVTVKDLMLHISGLPGDVETKTDWHGEETAVKKACAIKLENPPGTHFRYSDINFFLLGEIVQRVSKMPLEKFVATEIYGPLKMTDTGYLPPKSKVGRIAPTEVVNGKPYRGVVHDPTARHMGGVAGHAGLFFTASDLARYAQMLVNGGELDGVRIFKPETVRLMTTIQSPPAISAHRGLGWDIDSGYSGPRGKIFPIGSYGHTGWTGTSLWIDPSSKSFVIFLSNRNHPDETGNVIALRAKLGTLGAEAIGLSPAHTAKPGSGDHSWIDLHQNESTVAGAGADGDASAGDDSGKTLNGIDVLEREKFAPLKGMRIALITNHTGEDDDRNPTIDLLKNAPGVELKVLFSPEHGIRGEVDEKVGDSVDKKTGLPIYSLYGKSFKPTAEQLKDVDALVFDIQDIGCRFYTYTATMGYTLQAAGENGKKYFILDRVNPINGVMVEGPVRIGKPSFVAYHEVPLRYGMTIGELAQMCNAERNFKTDLTVIKVQNWKRSKWYDQTGLPWTNQSPNIRNLTEAILYPGIGLLESAASVGRGTDTPFEVVGAPYVKDTELAAELNKANLPGVTFVPIRFTPTYSTHKGEACGGVYIMLTDREHCDVVDVGLLIAETLYRLYPNNFNPDKMEHLLMHPPTMEAVKANKSLAEIHALWAKDLGEFQKRREKYLIY